MSDSEKLHVHPEEIVPELMGRLDREIPEFKEYADEQSGQCIIGTSHEFNDRFASILHQTVSGPPAIANKVYTVNTLAQLADAILLVAKEIVKPRTNDESLELAVLYVLRNLVRIANEKSLLPNFGLWRFEQLSDRYLNLARAAKTDIELSKLVKRAEELDAACRVELHQGTFRYFPSTLTQTHLMAGDEEINKHPEWNLSRELCTHILTALAEINKTDDRFVRSDAEVAVAIDQVRTELKQRDLDREPFNQSIATAIRQSGIAKPDVNIIFEYEFDGVVKLEDASDIKVLIHRHPVMPNTYGVVISAVPKGGSGMLSSLQSLLADILGNR